MRWGFAWQRPQHLLARLAQHYQVLFVEERVTNIEITKPRLMTYMGNTHTGTTPMLAVM